MVKVVEPVEKSDEAEVLAWLKTQDRQTQIWFATRCVLRALPEIGRQKPLPMMEQALASFRTMAIACTAVTLSPDNWEDLKARARSAERKINSYYQLYTPPNARVYVAHQPLLNSVMSYNDTSRVVRFSNFTPYRAKTAADNSCIVAASNDSKEIHNWHPLWNGANQVPELASAWQLYTQQLLEDEADWSFWIEWYEAILEGNPLPWELTQRIALEITEEEWEAGQARVAERIAEIQDKWAAELASERKDNVPEATDAQKASVVERVTQNRDAIALAVAGVLEQLEDYRERFRGLNGLDPEHREELLSFIDSLSAKLSDLLTMLPDQPDVIETEGGGKFIDWLRECKALIPGVARRYTEPENVVEAGVPVGVILGCTSIGAMIGGPVGAGAGSVVGSLISNQMKPGQAAKALLAESPKTPED